MVELLLTIVVVSLWLLLRPAVDWYVVESRECYDELLCDYAFGNEVVDLGKTSLRSHGCIIEVDYGSSVMVRRKNGGHFNISNYEFEELSAAVIYAENLHGLFASVPSVTGGKEYRQFIVWQVVSRSRKRAARVPRKSYGRGLKLKTYPEVFYLGWRERHYGKQAPGSEGPQN